MTAPKIELDLRSGVGRATGPDGTQSLHQSGAGTTSSAGPPVFGAPIASGTAPEQATRCALSLQHEVARLDDRLADHGLPSIP